MTDSGIWIGNRCCSVCSYRYVLIWVFLFDFGFDFVFFVLSQLTSVFRWDFFSRFHWFEVFRLRCNYFWFWWMTVTFRSYCCYLTFIFYTFSWNKELPCTWIYSYTCWFIWWWPCSVFIFDYCYSFILFFLISVVNRNFICIPCWCYCYCSIFWCSCRWWCWLRVTYFEDFRSI